MQKCNTRTRLDLNTIQFYGGTDLSMVDLLTNGNWQAIRMPYFYFDLVVGEDCKDQGGMILEDTQIAFEKADSLASELYIVRPELRSRGCAVRLADGENKELYRTPLDPIPAWATARPSA
jgi:hypothetical protein